MSLVRKLLALVKEPPPEFVFELSEAGIAVAYRADKNHTFAFEPLEPGVITVSPLHDNIQQPEVVASQVRKLVPNSQSRNRRPAALILPDYCGRIAVLDFDQFPSDPLEQQSLVRFRIKKSVPFDLESAVVSHAAQPRQGSKGVDVVVAVVPLEILARYEAPLRAAGLHPGYVTTSTLAALRLLADTGLAVTAKLSGRVFTLAVTNGNSLKLLRCVELADVSVDEILNILFPTFAYVEDELGSRPAKLALCGFGDLSASLTAALETEMSLTVEPLRSQYGTPGPYNAGMYGYLQSLEAA